MTLKEFFDNYDIKIAWYLLQSHVPEIYILKKTIEVKQNVNDLTYAQFVAASMLLERQITCFDLIRSLIVIFNWDQITNDQFFIGGYSEYLYLVDNIDVSSAYPIARHYKRILNKQCRVHKKRLSYKPKAEDIQDGIDMFNELSFYNSCRAVAINFGVKPNDVMGWNYSEVFVELLYQKINNKFQENRIRRINKT